MRWNSRFGGLSVTTNSWVCLFCNKAANMSPVGRDHHVSCERCGQYDTGPELFNVDRAQLASKIQLHLLSGYCREWKEREKSNDDSFLYPKLSSPEDLEVAVDICPSGISDRANKLLRAVFSKTVFLRRHGQFVECQGLPTRLCKTSQRVRVPD